MFTFPSSQRQARHLTVLGAGCLALSTIATGTLGSPAQQRQVNVVWQGQNECDVSAAIRDEVDRLLAGSVPASSPLTVTLRITRVATGYALVVETPGGLRRQIEAASCEELAKPAAVIIALSIDPAALTRTLEATNAEAPLDVPPPEQASVPAETPGSQAPAAVDVNLPPATPERDEAGPLAATPAVVPYVRAGMTTDFGALPQPSTGAAVGAGVRLGVMRLEAGIVYLPVRTVTLDADGRKGADLDVLAATLLGCAVPFMRGIELGACGGIEAGRIAGQSFGVRTPGAATTSWLAARGGGVLGVPVTARFGFVVRGDLVARIGRSEFLIEGLGSVHEPSPIGARAELALELRFP